MTMSDVELLQTLEWMEGFTTIRVLAEGSGGVTRLVMCGDEGPFVLKEIPLQLASGQAWQRSLAVVHPRVARVYDVRRLPDKLVTLSEFVEGESLRSLVEHEGALAPEEAIGVLRDVCHGVAALHELGIIHRDISPGNVIVSPRGAVLVDLGNARVHTDGEKIDTVRLGTAGFSAPEQYGFAQTDVRSDVFALGRLLQYMLTGQVPQEGASLDGLPPQLRRVVEKACAFAPGARYQAVRDFERALPREGQLMRASRVRASGQREASADAWRPSDLWDWWEADPRAIWRDWRVCASRVRKALVVVVWAVMALFAVAFCGGCAPYFGWGIACGLAFWLGYAAMWLGVFGLPGLELCCLLLGRGGYAPSAGPVRHRLLRLLVCCFLEAAICLGAAGALMLIADALFPGVAWIVGGSA
jgi:hypothetical protein